jgi:membrane-associated phospholipid phosphatase
MKGRVIPRVFIWLVSLFLLQPLVALAVQPVVGERLSDWVLRVHGVHADTVSLHWLSQAERQLQGQLLRDVVSSLETSPHLALPASQRLALADWLLKRPVTGRLTLAVHEPRALQALPDQDPIWREGDTFVLYPRSAFVVVLGVEARPCVTRHTPGAVVLDYLHACTAQLPSLPDADHAWVAQPDGRTRSVGVAPWSLTPQPQPGPGSWLWAPGRTAGIPDELSSNLIRFLATQAPPDDEAIAWMSGVSPVSVERFSAHTDAASASATTNDWGELGYLQTPSARMGQAGLLRSHISRVSPYTRLTVMMQPLDRFEFGFRYTSISNRLYGPVIAGDQSYKDKSIDVKVQLRHETAHGPAIALGLRDLGGTGLFSSEYLVASKRWGNWDASLGLGWGNLGTRGNIRNPLSVFGKAFDDRPAAASSTGGTTNIDAFFKGSTSWFGGVQWASAGSPWVFKAELDGNSYQREPQDNTQAVRSPVNIGVAYRHSPSTTFSMGLERGNTLMLGLTLQGQLNEVFAPKVLDPVPPPFTPEPPASLPPRGWADVAQEIDRHTGWKVQSVTQGHGSVTVQAETDGALYLQQRIDRVVRLMHALAPNGITDFHLQLTQRGLPLTQVSIDRLEWVLQHRSPWPTASALPTQRVHEWAPVSTPSDWHRPHQGLRFRWSPTYEQIVGGPDGFILYQLGAALHAEWAMTTSTWLDGTLRVGLSNNYDRFVYEAPSNLPRVRTFLRDYVTTSRVTVPRLQLTHVRHLGGNHYGSVYAGIFESMYAGVGAEWLYRPHLSPWAVGIEANRVRQRAFEQDFGLRDYRVNTGHATLYWNTGWNDVHMKLQAGRYLAGDVGATLDVSRSFSNGVTIGAWATKTNVSAEQFGEGSFDKGIYVNIPFDALLPVSTSDTAFMAWNPLTRDGGARLYRAYRLMDLTPERDPRALRWRTAQPTPARSAQATAYVLHEPTFQPLHAIGPTAIGLRQQVGAIPRSTWLTAGGALLASSLLDTRADRWAQQHQNGRSRQVAALGNAMPYMLLAGVGTLATGMAGEPASMTAQTSLYAGAYAVGASLAVRAIAGRSRPQAEQGAMQWAGPSSGSLKSSFVSNHTALAFALVTPFAQQHQMPWLYGVAVVTAFGRVQSREHWLSDVVGGALLGYGIGSLLTQQQTGAYMPRIRLGSDSVVADWAF